MSSLHAKPRERSANIFINYRREDSAGHAGRLFDALSSGFSGRLFMDVDTLEPGVDFVDAINNAVGACEVLLVVIGQEWLTIKDKSGLRRLDDPADFVRLEVESALERRIRVIPVLVQDTSMPRAEELPPSLSRLARRNAIELSDARWAYDVGRLAHTINDILKENPASGPAAAALPAPVEKAAPPPAPVAPAVAAKPTGSRVWLLYLAALVLVAVVVLVSWTWIGRTPGGTPGGNAQMATLGAVMAPPNGVTTETPASGEPTPDPAGDVNSGNSVLPAVTGAPLAGNRPPVAHHAAEEPPRPPVRVPTASVPIPKTEAVTIPAENEAPAPVAAVDLQPAVTKPARATILSPRDGETVGSDVMVQGLVFGLADQQVFLGIRQKNGSIYPRGEFFPNADGEWSIKLKSSKEKTFDILVVTSSSQDATQVLRDQRSRDNGLAILPGGASIISSVVTLKKQGKLLGVLNPKRAKL